MDNNENQIPTPPIEVCLKLDEINAWKNTRVEQYGGIGEQLNLLWDDIDNGLLGTDAKNGTWYNHIKTIKSSIVKPNMDILQQELDELLKP
jgi:hypothetical protein